MSVFLKGISGCIVIPNILVVEIQEDLDGCYVYVNSLPVFLGDVKECVILVRDLKEQIESYYTNNLTK